MSEAPFPPDESASPGDDEARAERIERLMDAIDHIKADQREEARRILRDLIRLDSDFEDAWLWMSVAVDTLDQTSVCLDNVLRVNPRNAAAADALYNLRIPQVAMQRRRARLRLVRDAASALLWILIGFVLISGMCAISTAFNETLLAAAGNITTSQAPAERRNDAPLQTDLPDFVPSQ